MISCRTVVPLLLLLAACTGGVAEDVDEGEVVGGALTVPGKVKVNGRVVDVETNYLPRVVQCENPGAPFEALKAQAVAARTYLTYRAGNRATPSIRDGESDQVYTCPANNNGRFVSEDVTRAVQATTGEIVFFNGAVTAGFFVAGSSRAGESCRATSDATDTERFVTYNFGLVEGTSKASSIGNRGDDRNRGCFSQRLANCLADTTSLDYQALLRYFYGSDAQVALFGAAPPTADEIAVQAAQDLSQATCWSATMGRPVPVDSCVQSAADRKLYQCQPDGKFVLTALTVDGTRMGPSTACAGELTL